MTEQQRVEHELKRYDLNPAPGVRSLSRTDLRQLELEWGAIKRRGPEGRLKMVTRGNTPREVPACGR